MRRLNYFFSLLKVCTTNDLWDQRTNQWKIFTRKINRIRGIPHWALTALHNSLADIKSAQTTNNQNTNITSNWRWKSIKTPLGSMEISTK
jgi:hypothetical protein